MLVFPQLVTGASALYPVKKTSVQRTAMNVMADGSVWIFGDPDGAAKAWELHATGMTAAEWNAIEALYQATSGMWQTFTFLDPTGNLLAQSENLGAGAWTNGPLIQLTSGVADPLGTTRATRITNTGEAAASVAQVLSVPGTFEYCISAWARAAGTSNVTLTAFTTGANLAKTFALSGAWSRIVLAGNLGQSTSQVTFGAQLDSGATVDVFGMQVEAQLAPSDYKQTNAKGGVYSKTRFGSDNFSVTAQGIDVYDAVIQIVDTEG
ncbi:MAG TPA: hypothetical protein VKX39_15125 [Bryobacteraceae bacterium]|jgi:hypothetical protein|nr:hypothetical protein [Bryobacteraceae bacterium]